MNNLEEWMHNFLKQAGERKWWGKITINFNSGKIVNIKEERSITITK